MPGCTYAHIRCSLCTKFTPCRQLPRRIGTQLPFVYLALLSTPAATSAESRSATRQCTRVSGRNSMEGGMARALRRPAIHVGKLGQQ
jgi:hypothetical protein